MKAIGRYIVIDPQKEDNIKTKGGLILTDKQREDIRYRRAKVVNPGTDVKGIKKNDDIFYDRNAGFNIEIKQHTYKIIKDLDVVIVL